MKKSTEKLLADLHALQTTRQRLLRVVIKERELAVGTVSEVSRKCGNPRCHCAKEGGHLQVSFLFKDKENGRRRCKLIRRDDEQRMLRAGENYRECRQAMQQLRAIDLEEKQILMALIEGRAIEYE